MEEQPSRDEIDVLRRRAADEIDFLRGAAGWCRGFAERLGRHPSRPDLENAVRVFRRKARDCDDRAVAHEVAFGAPEEERDGGVWPDDPRADEGRAPPRCPLPRPVVPGPREWATGESLHRHPATDHLQRRASRLRAEAREISLALWKTHDAAAETYAAAAEAHERSCQLIEEARQILRIQTWRNPRSGRGPTPEG